jgi:hypothetical protein
MSPRTVVVRSHLTPCHACGVVESFDNSTFSERDGETFRVLCDDGSTLELELVSVTPGPVAPNDSHRGRVPFSIVFRGALEPVLPQRTYRFEHDELGSFELFIVPIGPDAAGMRYEAVFG